MKTKLLILFFLFFSIHRVYTQNQKAISTKGSINQTLAFKSTILGYDVHYAIYLPPDYALSDKHYPVLFLLHGYTDDHTSWIKQGKINTIMDKGIAKGEIEPMILIIPDGKYFWYINDYQSVARYEDFMFKEFFEHKNCPGIPGH